jgi:subtilase family serine protease
MNPRHRMSTYRLVTFSAFIVISATLAVPALAANETSDAASSNGSEMSSEHSNSKHKRVCDEVNGSFSCNARVIIDANGKPAAKPTPDLGLTPAQIRKAYNLPATISATRPPIIGVVVAYDNPNILKDLTTFSSAMGIPSLPACRGTIAASAKPCFQKVDQNGGTQYPVVSSQWALESALDVQTAHGVCTNCSILLVEAVNNEYPNMMAAVDKAVSLGASVVSNSYGSVEFASQSQFDSRFNRPGVAFTFSTGDFGYGVQYPASSPFVTAVGGTSLFLNGDGSYMSEAAWGGAGSGCSAYSVKPTWQTDGGCSTRTVADVAAVADPNTGAAIYTSLGLQGQKGWMRVGGTSLAAPIIAAVYALSGNTSGAANSIPYINSAGNLRDVSVGSNGSCGNYLCMALSGFDGPTGLGTPFGVRAF